MITIFAISLGRSTSLRHKEKTLKQFVSANVPHLSDQSSNAPARALHRRAFGLFPAQYLVTSSQRRFLGRRLGITMQEFHQKRRQEFFRVRVRFILAGLATICLSWSSIATADYKYPYRDPYLVNVGKPPFLKRVISPH